MANEVKNHNSSSRLLRLQSVLDMFPVSRAAWYQGIKEGKYPQPVRLGKRSVAWHESEVLQLIEKLERRTAKGFISSFNRYAASTSRNVSVMRL